MDSFFFRFRNSLVLIALVLAQTIALAVQVQRPSGPVAAASGTVMNRPDSAKVTVLRYWMSSIFTPVERLLHGSSLHVRNVWTNYIDLRHTRQQTRDLQNEVARLRLEQAAFAEDAQQGHRMQALLDFRQHYIATTVVAQIISTSGSDRSSMVLLDKGSNDGLKPDQAVITPDGIVGKLRDVFPNTAQLLLINDPTAGAGVMLESSRIRGIIHGTSNGKIQITNLTEDSRIKTGERVLTSGGDQIFPRGLPVGVIVSIVPDPDHQPYTAITIKPIADLPRLEEVLVITGTQTALPASAEQDLTTATATAVTAKRAAELAAERLSGVHETPADAAQAPATTGVPGIPNSGAPRPAPALRPDRFSPGNTPPADQLTPGSRPKPSEPVEPATPSPATTPATPPQT